MNDGKLVQVKGLVSPFSIVIDAQNRVWVSNALDITIVMFPADDPSKAKSISAAGLSVRGIALDSKGNVWTASLMSLDFPPPVIPKRRTDHRTVSDRRTGHRRYVTPTKPTGVIQMTRPDGTQPTPKGFSGLPINVPWGLSIDGNDDVWFGNFYGRGVVLMAGDDTKGHPAGTKAGDVIHQFQSGSIQRITEVAVDPAGNVWAANNWNDLQGVMAYDPSHLDLGRRFGHHRHLWRRRPGEDPAHRRGAQAVSPHGRARGRRPLCALSIPRFAFATSDAPVYLAPIRNLVSKVVCAMTL